MERAMHMPVLCGEMICVLLAKYILKPGWLSVTRMPARHLSDRMPNGISGVEESEAERGEALRVVADDDALRVGLAFPNCAST